jgi:UDP-N-acetylmuramoyl-tripeptide--D-alanyl-D-alanine ligase
MEVSMLTKVASLLFLVATLAFATRRILSYLRYFQQEEYNERRFVAWLKSNRALDSRGTVCAVAVMLPALFIVSDLFNLLAAAVGGITLLWIAYLSEEDPRKTGKLKLNMTQRARKIHLVSCGLLVLLAAPALLLVTLFCPCPPLLFGILAGYSIVLIQSPPWLLLPANKLLSPFEKRLQGYYLADAKRILADVDPYIIGITGSYGKTGAKAALGDLLQQCLSPTFWPKKSINTVMGITRTIREELKSYHRYAVIEMGAYNIGSIKRLCDFTPPKAALVTAVGIMHLERFGSPENVYKAKSEIAQAVPVDGVLVCNGDSPNARRMSRQYDKGTTLLYGLDLGAGHLDCYASNLLFDESGSSFTIHWNGQQLAARTPLLGRPAVSNILGAFTLACALGADPTYAIAVIASMQPVDNRLVLDRSGSVSFLRDAYNSNPTGFAAALEVLGGLPAQRRILITPGMIELGDLQSEENRRIAALAAEVCDLIIVVGKANRDALVLGLDDAHFEQDKRRIVASRDDAFELLRNEQRSGDLILIENDLPDLHENSVRF